MQKINKILDIIDKNIGRHMIGIIDYNVGNLASVYNACKILNIKAEFVKDPSKVKAYDKIILPGVGAFGDAMEYLRQKNMHNAIQEFAKSGKYILGICLGMQLLLEESNEFGRHNGLGLIPGKVIKFDTKHMLDDEKKIPHVGWNKVLQKSHPIFDGLKNPYLYFVHSYHAMTDEEHSLAKTHYGYDFVSAIYKDNIIGFQAHPEKSHDNGLKILKNFMEL